MYKILTLNHFLKNYLINISTLMNNLQAFSNFAYNKADIKIKLYLLHLN